MRIQLFFAIAAWIVLCDWTIQQVTEIKKAEWLIGTWEDKTLKGSIYESWTKVNDTEFAEKSYMVKEKDTIALETVRLAREQDKLFYIPTVKNQNGGLPVRFALKTISDTALIFENPQHDFPQVISYTKCGTDSMVAEISGIQNGQKRKEIFPMKRVK